MPWSFLCHAIQTRKKKGLERDKKQHPDPGDARVWEGVPGAPPTLCDASIHSCRGQYRDHPPISMLQWINGNSSCYVSINVNWLMCFRWKEVWCWKWQTVTFSRDKCHSFKICLCSVTAMSGISQNRETLTKQLLQVAALPHLTNLQSILTKLLVFCMPTLWTSHHCQKNYLLMTWWPPWINSLGKTSKDTQEDSS